MNRWNVVNGVLFQVAWFACVLGGAAGSNLWGALILVLMLTQAVLGAGWRRDLTLATITAVVGFLLDTLWIRFGVLDYGSALAPPWIVMLWVAVGLSVHHCLSYFKSRPWLGGTLAGLGAPFSYLAGERFGAVVIDDPYRLMAVAVSWLLLFAVLFIVTGDGSRGAGERRPRNIDSRNDYERAH